MLRKFKEKESGHDLGIITSSPQDTGCTAISEAHDSKDSFSSFKMDLASAEIFQEEFQLFRHSLG